MKITILGAGAWGTALAITLARKHDVMLWGRNPQAMEEAGRQRENQRYLPGFPLPDELTVTADFSAAVRHVCGEPQTSLLIVASSVAGLRGLAGQLRGHPIPNLVWLCKGLEEDTRLLPHQIVQQVLGPAIPAGALSGPSFAQEVARGLPCALTIAGADGALCERVVTAVHGGNIRIYSSDDLIGVEIGGAVKNILAIATGVADGLQLGLNARAALITRGLAEITRLGVALGGRPETFMGLSGVGDLILTCTGDLSRNRRVGLGLAQNKKLEDIVTELGHVAEGVRCAKAVRELAQEKGVDMPITNAVAAALFDGVSVQEMVARLLSRDPREETL
ncbi:MULTISPECIES: NAD(P)H-dependent glycerol-3-phosphate dehydrogenase [unclassified Herbaspirillum]|uniref:NAD(P)H-dependent glycerol-3-phosphate dehydrogenase n=1 Tax=unclassified Herbaspirillum TaxID=2624150 RepID=UPI0011540CC4|nr:MULTISPECIES: NAD(P)H-dependent glycerol-3-phosphate dehydrogenase [unclassified Herbaspirillum]MBB5393686.1 glycerol-3-phosphate dehydrogenase (NAD(P)+) [Herbaspirillum sp. SJZ102]TQK01452.1 glycerol 3-phosphate dehydrogenase (NAD(P)+) [Herbaspirillum sp. SJZ130]TQK05848.1 glycerol 3-phosphate dehydrogenase (NAD(P)+) [Herbaspirillum sp. SJZ106]